MSANVISPIAELQISSNKWGASRDDWNHFSSFLGLTSDLLPVVSNHDAAISPQSKMRSLGKTPSRYNSRGHAAGIAQWTQKITTPTEITQWSEQPDYGLCIQTRNVRALDVDIDNSVLAADIHVEINRFLNIELPTRRRLGADRFLLAFTLPGDYPKRVIRTDYGVIEFLGTGQQFIAVGMHKSGERYKWVGGLPNDIPDVAPEQFEKLWRRLTECFATDAPTDAATSSKAPNLTEAIQNDPTALYLVSHGLNLGRVRNGAIDIRCPWEDQHTGGEPGDTSTTYLLASANGKYREGHFKCLHAHCEGRTNLAFKAALGISEADFDVLNDDHFATKSESSRYTFEPWETSINAKPPGFIVKNVLPEAGLGVIFGESGSGKTFFALDIACAIARGVEWRGIHVKQGAVAYIAAEDATGVRMRVKAYAHKHEVEPGSMPLAILADSPNFMKGDDVKEVIKALRAHGPVSAVFVDTWAQVTPGSNENSGEDMGKALAYCRALHRATDAIVVLIHHSGKDASKGARGWSGLRAAADCEIEVTRCERDRVATITKLKNAQDGAEFGFKLTTVMVGLDDDGDAITSCVLDHVDATPKTQRGKREPKGAVEKIVVRAVADLTIGGPVVTADVIDISVNHMPSHPATGGRDTRRQRVMRAIETLTERKVLGIEGDKIVLVSEK